jgi:hypothetical protein
MGGHLGMNRTFDRLKQYVSWPGLKKEIEDYVRRCEICQKNKVTQNNTKLPLQITDTPDMVWEKCSMDVVGRCRTINTDLSGRIVKIHYRGANKTTGRNDYSEGFCRRNYLEIRHTPDTTDRSGIQFS